MTSGTFESVPIDFIFVDRDKRQRRTLDRIDELADSIAKNGLINPPVIRRSGELVAGERRYTAVRQLGWTHVPVQWVDDLSEEELHAIELEENIRRVDLTWQDQCVAVARYHKLRGQMEEGWSADKTADAIGMSPRSVNRFLMLEKKLDAPRIRTAPKMSVAVGIIERELARKRDSLAVEPMDDAPTATNAAPLLNADFHEWAQTYDGPPFNLIHCDFPYGVNADKHDQGAAASHGGYADSFDDYTKLIDQLRRAMRQIVAPSAHLIFWFSMDYYQFTYAKLREMEWIVQPHPLIWFKSDNTGIIPDPSRGPRRVYETAFFASRGDRKIVQAIANCFAAPVTKEVHMSEKSLPMLRHFMRMVCDETTSILDPTCGSGNALRAAVACGASRALGLERDPEFFQRAVEAWNDRID